MEDELFELYRWGYSTPEPLVYNLSYSWIRKLLKKYIQDVKDYPNKYFCPLFNSKK
jgi:hypothetical protein